MCIFVLEHFGLSLEMLHVIAKLYKFITFCNMHLPKTKANTTLKHFFIYLSMDFFLRDGRYYYFFRAIVELSEPSIRCRICAEYYWQGGDGGGGVAAGAAVRSDGSRLWRAWAALTAAGRI